MWPEPLTVRTTRTKPDTVVITTSDGNGNPVARVTCVHSSECGSFGEMRIARAGGRVRQHARALVLLVRESIRYADGIGLTVLQTQAPTNVRAFAERMFGISAEPNGYLLRHILHVRTNVLDRTDADGNER